MSLPTRAACENREPGARECGRPAIWRGWRRNGQSQLFCDACHCTGHDAAAAVRWEPIKLAPDAPPPGGLFGPERDQIDWITEGF